MLKIAAEIQKIMIDKNIKKGELADRCGWTASNLYNKMKRDNFSVRELETIAEALGCELEINFTPKKEQ
ncbi:MAG: helix-turn-helix transcriptional regulator [Lachnospiraceae bacterium]|nr:helix-turn-helix transcriptional regulator [Lachnospiraceae bacterium]